MKITGIDVFILQTPLEQPFAFSQGWVRRRSATLVRVTAGDGFVGWGEAFAQGLEPPQIAAAVIEHGLAPLLMEEDPRSPAVLWEKMYVQSRDYGRKGSVVAAISAVDTALWDLVGKIYGEPIHRLLGGAVRERVQPYATGFYRIHGQGEASRLADEAIMHREAGFGAMKVKLGFGLRDDIEVMEAVVGALGDDVATGRVELMVDSNHAYGRAEALALGRVLDEFGLRWYEEPVVPEDIVGYAELRSQLTTPIAGGENEHTAFGFAPLIQAGGLDIAQPDVGSCGGVTAARDIAAIAHANGVAVNPHVWGSAIAQAASLQFIATLPVPHASLFAKAPILEYDRSDHPFRQQLIEQPWQVEEGMIAIPNGPGLGIEVNMDTVERYDINH